MDRIWHNHSLKVYKDASEDVSHLNIFPSFGSFLGKNGQNRKNEPQNLVDDPYLKTIIFPHHGSTLKNFSEDLSRLVNEIDLILHTPNVFDPFNSVSYMGL